MNPAGSLLKKGQDILGFSKDFTRNKQKDVKDQESRRLVRTRSEKSFPASSSSEQVTHLSFLSVMLFQPGCIQCSCVAASYQVLSIKKRRIIVTLLILMLLFLS